jgi:hypothetical protein
MQSAVIAQIHKAVNHVCAKIGVSVGNARSMFYDHISLLSRDGDVQRLSPPERMPVAHPLRKLPAAVLWRPQPRAF